MDKIRVKSGSNGHGRHYYKIFISLGFNLLNTSTKCFTTIGNEGNVLQEEWLKEDQPKAYKCVTAVSQFYKN